MRLHSNLLLLFSIGTLRLATGQSNDPVITVAVYPASCPVIISTLPSHGRITRTRCTFTSTAGAALSTPATVSNNGQSGSGAVSTGGQGTVSNGVSITQTPAITSTYLTTLVAGGSTIVTTNSAGSTYTTVSGGSTYVSMIVTAVLVDPAGVSFEERTFATTFVAGGSTIVTTNSAGSTYTTVSGGSTLVHTFVAALPVTPTQPSLTTYATTYVEGAETLVTTNSAGLPTTSIFGGSTVVSTVVTNVPIPPSPSGFPTITGSTVSQSGAAQPMSLSVYGGTTITTTVGGLTTSFIAGGTTVLVVATASASSGQGSGGTAPSATDHDAVANAQIGRCSQMNGLLLDLPETDDAALVTCGNRYNGTVLRLSRRMVAQDCESDCASAPDCMAFTYDAGGVCSLYSYVFALYESDVPSYSALRLAGGDENLGEPLPGSSSSILVPTSLQTVASGGDVSRTGVPSAANAASSLTAQRSSFIASSSLVSGQSSSSPSSRLAMGNTQGASSLPGGANSGTGDATLLATSTGPSSPNLPSGAQSGALTGSNSLVPGAISSSPTSQGSASAFVSASVSGFSQGPGSLSGSPSLSTASTRFAPGSVTAPPVSSGISASSIASSSNPVNSVSGSAVLSGFSSSGLLTASSSISIPTLFPSNSLVTSLGASNAQSSESTTSTTPFSPAPPLNSAPPVYACPSVDSTMVVDQNDNQYTVMCDTNTDGASAGLVSASNSFNDCFYPCDIDPQCVGFTYQGGPDGVGAGLCYLKRVGTGGDSPVFSSQGRNLVSALRRALSPGSSSPSSGSPARTELSSSTGILAGSSALSLSNGATSTTLNLPSGSSSAGASVDSASATLIPLPGPPSGQSGLPSTGSDLSISAQTTLGSPTSLPGSDSITIPGVSLSTSPTSPVSGSNAVTGLPSNGVPSASTSSSSTLSIISGGIFSTTTSSLILSPSTSTGVSAQGSGGIPISPETSGLSQNSGTIASINLSTSLSSLGSTIPSAISLASSGATELSTSAPSSTLPGVTIPTLSGTQVSGYTITSSTTILSSLSAATSGTEIMASSPISSLSTPSGLVLTATTITTSGDSTALVATTISSSIDTSSLVPSSTGSSGIGGDGGDPGEPYDPGSTECQPQSTNLCPDYEGRTFSGCDGSSFLIVCSQTYVQSTMLGISTLFATSLAECINFCVNQGTQCMGVTYDSSSQQCDLQRKMIPAPFTGPIIQGAVRIRGPTSTSGLRKQLIINGGFDLGLGLYAWNTIGSLANLLFAVLNLQAVVNVQLSSLTCVLLGLVCVPVDVQLYQALNTTSLATAVAGTVWYLGAWLNFTNVQVSTDVSCIITFQTDNDVLWRYNYVRASQQGPINGSGILTKPATQFLVDANCTGTKDVTVGFDDINWHLYPPSIGLKPIIPAAVQLVKDGTFDLGQTLWTITTNTRTDLAITAGKAVMAFNRITSLLNMQTDNTCYFVQQLSATVYAGLNFTLTANVNINFPAGASGTCYASIQTSETLWTAAAAGVTTTQAYLVNVRGVLGADANILRLYGNCNGLQAPTITWDNIVFTANPSS